jgi:hypothetical protein
VKTMEEDATITHGVQGESACSEEGPSAAVKGRKDRKQVKKM